MLETSLSINMPRIKQLLDEVEQNIVICHWQMSEWRADQLFADAVGNLYFSCFSPF